MDYWITLGVSAALALMLGAAIVTLLQGRYKLLREIDRMHRALGEAQKLRNEAQEFARHERNQCMDAMEEAERARKECAMHEKERRQLEEKILHLKEEYEAQAARADELVRREMENFLGYNGTERGQKELNDDTDG